VLWWTIKWFIFCDLSTFHLESYSAGILDGGYFDPTLTKGFEKYRLATQQTLWGESISSLFLPFPSLPFSISPFLPSLCVPSLSVGSHSPVPARDSVSSHSRSVPSSANKGFLVHYTVLLPALDTCYFLPVIVLYVKI